jgi:hypothetical protein
MRAMGMRAASGPAGVLAAGMVTTFAGNPLLLALDAPVEVEVELRFVRDAAESGAAIRLVEQRPPRLVYEVVNCEDGRGSADPVLLADADPSLIFLHFRVFRYGRSEDWTVHYTFYSVEKSAIGWVPVDRGPGGNA